VRKHCCLNYIRVYAFFENEIPNSQSMSRCVTKSISKVLIYAAAVLG
jgi:hypothetical protein